MSAELIHDEIQVLYEMSLSITPKSNVEQTIESAISVYLQKLNCSAAVVLTPMGSPSDDEKREVVTTLPDHNILSDLIDETLDLLPDTEEEVASTLPLVEELESEKYGHIMSLPDFGVLLLLKRGSPLPDNIVASLPDLNEKLATACNRLAVQKQYETQYRTLFQEAPVMFALTREVNDEPIIEDCNDRFAEKLGYAAERLRDCRLADFYTEESRERLLSGGYDDALEGQFGTAERIFRTKNGQKVITTMRATPRYDENGTVLGTRALFIDVTELKRRKVQSSVLNRVLRHNIRNNVTVIQSKLDLAMNREADTTDEYLEKLYQKTENLMSTVENARQTQRLIDKIEIKQQDAAEFIDFIIPRARSEFPDATVEVAIESEPVLVLGTNALQHALWELIENACEHAGDSPSVRMTVCKHDSTATITVVDDGPGIPPVEHQILGAGKESDLEHGSGLGLWIVHWVVDISGGDLTFAVDDGTVVTVTLPLAESVD